MGQMFKIKKFISLILILLLSFIIYLSVVGVKTERLNPLIKKKLVEYDENLNVNINDIYIKFDILSLSFKVLSKNPIFTVNKISLNADEIESNISLKSLFLKNFPFKNFILITNDNNLKDLIKVLRFYKNNFQITILDKLVTQGNTNFKIYLEMENDGKIKDNYFIEGKLENLKINLFNKDNISGDLSYLIKENRVFINNSNFNYKEFNFRSNKIDIKKINDNFKVSGDFFNNNSKIFLKDFNNFLKFDLNNFSNLNIDFNTSNIFSFDINSKLKVENVRLSSKINIDEIKYKIEDQIFLDIFDNQKEIKIFNKKINVEYKNLSKIEKDQLFIKSNGAFEINKNTGEFSYEYDLFENEDVIKGKLNLENIPLKLKFIDFEKDKKSPFLMTFEAEKKKNGNYKLNKLNIKNENNILNVSGLEITNNKKVVGIEKLNLKYSSSQKKNFDISVINEEKYYYINSRNFDGSKIINNIIDNGNKSIFKNLTKKIKINFENLYIDKVNYLKNVIGTVEYNKNLITNLNINGYFENGEKLSITRVKKNDEVITNILTKYPKPLVDRYEFIKGFDEGILDFQSIKRKNKSNSLLIIDNFKVKEVPALAKILTLASLQGIADLLTGEGIRFSDFEMKFTSENNLIEIQELYAIGPAISILMSGYIEKKDIVSLRGTLVPATTINKTISSIPLLGDILVGKKIGEGVFGVSFKVKGPPNNLKTTVNPIKTLTPRFITRTLEKLN